MRNKNFNASIFIFSQNQAGACEVKLDESGRLHALDEPAVIYPELEEQWWVDGKLHRLDGPAIINSGGRAWFTDGELHRKDGPAVKCGFWRNGIIGGELIVCRSEFWYYGRMHRENGPAVLEIDGSHEYWIKGTCTRSVRADE